MVLQSMPRMWQCRYLMHFASSTWIILDWSTHFSHMYPWVFSLIFFFWHFRQLLNTSNDRKLLHLWWNLCNWVSWLQGVQIKNSLHRRKKVEDNQRIHHDVRLEHPRIYYQILNQFPLFYIFFPSFIRKVYCANNKIYCLLDIYLLTSS